MDYGKYLYLRAKRERKARKGKRAKEIKEIRLRPKTGEHDVAFKIRYARRFLEDGYKVKVYVGFRGREITYPELGLRLLGRIATELEDVASIEQQPRMVGRGLLMLLKPK
jgi:translation initiation factor IF-3